MDPNISLIQKFYTAFQQRDYATMNSCYSENIVFSDPVFMILQQDEVRYMWEMLCKNAKDFSLTFSDIEAVDDQYYTCKWTASYTFSKTGNKVVSNCKAFMRIQNGLITEHSDAFRLSKWIGQAFGWKGVWFGWTGVMKRAVQNKAKKNLLAFMQKKAAE